MKATGKAYLVLGMAIAEALMTAALASAQIASGQNGQALDANNRVGSGGLNSGGTRVGVTPDQIIYGNVTGNKQFRGIVTTFDPGAFAGPTPGRFSDRFVAGSSAAPQPYQPQVDLSTAQPFYGASRGAAPPPGSVRLGYTGGYLGTSETPGTNFEMNQLNASANDWMAQPLGQSPILGTRSTFVGSPGEAYLQGQNADNQDTVFTGSALYGIQPLRSTFDNNTDFGTGRSNGAWAAPGDQFRVDSAEMRRMRSELESPDSRQQQQPGNQSNSNDSTGFGQGFNSRNESTTPANPGFSSDMQSGQATQRRYTIVSPELQSSQYREMRQRLAQYENPVFAQMEAQHDARIQKQAIARKLGTTQPAAPAAGGLGAGALVRPGMGEMTAQPLKVNSLATGIGAKGLHDMLASGEQLMREGKFQSAIDRYNVANQIAPNNPLVPLGRANAELGAGAYRLASADLHRVFADDHALLVAQYDLKSWFPADRLATIQKELQGLSAKDPKDEMPEFLLAYLAYNTAQPDEAAKHLAESKKRAVSNDPVLDLMEREWKLPGADKPPQTPPPDLNK